MAAGCVPAVSPGRPPRRARNAHLAVAFLPDGGRPASSPAAAGVRDRRRARDHRARRRASKVSTPAKRCRRCCGPGMLTDHEGYGAWERRGDRRRSRETTSPPSRRSVSSGQPPGPCSPGGRVEGSLRETVEREFDVASAGKPDEDLDGIAVTRSPGARLGPRRASVPARGRRICSGVAGRFRRGGASTIGAVRGYLAARLFGNWVAYYGQGLHAIVEYLQVALAVVKMEAVRHHAPEAPSSPWQTVTEAIRSADLLLVHLSRHKAAVAPAGLKTIRPRALPALRRHQHALGRRLLVLPEHAGPADAAAHPRQRAVGASDSPT